MNPTSSITDIQQAFKFAAVTKSYHCTLGAGLGITNGNIHVSKFG
jgi:hypothetical protein